MTEALGENWISNSLIASISLKGGVPQALHQDQDIALDARSPLTVNVMTIITDVDETNGGTLIIPGSHRVLSDAVRAQKPVGRLLPTINLDAPAGTVVITDGRLLHSTGINHTDRPRIVMLNGMQHPVIRQQENWMLSVRPDVLRRASPKLLQRMGFQATNAAQTNEGHGFGASGMIDGLPARRSIFGLLQTQVIIFALASWAQTPSPSNSMRPLPYATLSPKLERMDAARAGGISGAKRNP